MIDADEVIKFARDLESTMFGEPTRLERMAALKLVQCGDALREAAMTAGALESAKVRISQLNTDKTMLARLLKDATECLEAMHETYPDSDGSSSTKALLKNLNGILEKMGQGWITADVCAP